MDQIGFLFSGQGAQRPGMALAFYQTLPAVKALFDAAEQRRPGTLEQCFYGSESLLTATENTQPCLYLADLAAAMAVEAAGLKPQVLAGFSLGELAALAFGGAFSHMAGFDLACARGKIMAKAAKTVTAAMAAVVKLPVSHAEALCRQWAGVYPVNYNTAEQLVVAAVPEVLAAFQTAVKEAGGRCLPLKVSGGFHSPFMKDAAAEFGGYLRDFPMELPRLLCWSNRTGLPYGGDPKILLAEQIDHAVYWEKSVTAMAERDVGIWIEVGVGKILANMVKRILPQARVFSVETPADIIALKKEKILC